MEEVHTLYRQLAQLDVECAFVSPSLVPKKPGDPVRTDGRDALTLARCHRSGDLTAVWVADEDSQALRDLVQQRVPHSVNQYGTTLTS